MKEAICIFILVAPAVSWKLWKNRNGTVHPNPKEVREVGLIMFIELVFCKVAFLDGYTHSFSYSMLLTAKCVFVALTGFQLFFTYLFNWRWINRKENQGWVIDHPKLINKLWYTFNHLSSTAIPDKWVKGIHWSIRLLVYVSLFSAAVLWFVS